MRLTVVIFLLDFRLICSYFVLATTVKIIRGLYESGWSEGEIMYYNNELGEYHIFFNDGTSDFVKAEDTDGVELVLL